MTDKQQLALLAKLIKKVEKIESKASPLLTALDDLLDELYEAQRKIPRPATEEKKS